MAYTLVSFRGFGSLWGIGQRRGAFGFQGEKKIPDYLNRTSIVFTLKIQGLETIGNYRPISLCNAVYKIVSKIIVGRIRPFLDQLISPCQAALVPGRRGVDDAIIVQEIIHTMGKARGNCGYMALKIDLEKA